MVVNIVDYVVFCRDRNWLGKDMWNKGGVVIYIRKILIVFDVYCLIDYEVICVILFFFVGYCFLVCGVYNFLKYIYNEGDLMNYLLFFVD